MDISAVLKCARMVVKKKAEENPTGGIKMKTDGGVTIVAFTAILEELKKLEGRTCENCSCIDFGRDDKALCYPKNYSGYRKRGDSCSFHKPRL